MFHHLKLDNDNDSVFKIRILFSFHTSACVCACIAGGLRGWRVVNTQGMRQPSTASARVVRFGRHAPRGHRTEPAAAAEGSHPSAVVASAYDGSRRHRCRRRTRLPSTTVGITHTSPTPPKSSLAGRHSGTDSGERHPCFRYRRGTSTGGRRLQPWSGHR